MPDSRALLHHPTIESRWTVDPETGCWLWNGTRDEHGYGHCPAGRAHRVVYVEFGHELPDDNHLHHRCKNKPCVNPEHLEPLTPTQHRTLHGREDSHLEWADVRELRDAYARGGASIDELGERYGLSKSQVHNIVTNVKWHDPEFTPGRLAVCALEECGAEFIARRSHQRFCCPDHKNLWTGRRTWRRANGKPLDGPSCWTKGARDAA